MTICRQKPSFLLRVSYHYRFVEIRDDKIVVVVASLSRDNISWGKLMENSPWSSQQNSSGDFGNSSQHLPKETQVSSSRVPFVHIFHRVVLVLGRTTCHNLQLQKRPKVWTPWSCLSETPQPMLRLCLRVCFWFPSGQASYKMLQIWKSHLVFCSENDLYRIYNDNWLFPYQCHLFLWSNPQNLRWFSCRLFGYVDPVCNPQ